MLSHLRFHKRGHSNPNSPSLDQPPPSPFGGTIPSPINSEHHFQHSNLAHDGRPSSATSSALPPTLPLIPRVTSYDFSLSQDNQEPSYTAMTQQQGTLLQPAQHKSPTSDRTSGFIGGVALRKYHREKHTKAGLSQSRSTDNLTDLKTKEGLQKPIVIDTSAALLSPSSSQAPRSATNFSTPTDLQSTNAAPRGRRPAGARLTSDSNTPASFVAPVEQPRAKRGLPFLKNPMSTLLARRKNNHTSPEVATPLPIRTEEDFRIRGTKVHDFSAPRRTAEPCKALQSQSTSQLPLSTNHDHGAIQDSSSTGVRLPQQPVSQPQSTRSKTSNPFSPGTGSVQSAASQRSKHVQDEPATSSRSPEPAASAAPASNTVAEPEAAQASPASAPSSKTDAFATVNTSRRSARPRNVSLTDKDALSSIPRHMKSTSSRFSFDMIGPDSQEKILEERHRQKEMERTSACPRDSRFDDLDDDSFDYDAMMDDGGLEERIPGVNADCDDDPLYEDDFLVGQEDLVDQEHQEEMDDADNDQENFAGFVFQRSNPVSSLASPQVLGTMQTPRDIDGNVIGNAVSKDSPLFAQFPPNDTTVATSGLGIQGIDDLVEAERAVTPEVTALRDTEPQLASSESANPDDLYYDNGLLNYENEFSEDLAADLQDGTEPFDESIFDMDDTDQYGRPLPGAFAQAQSMRKAQQQRVSDMTTSGVSGQSGVSHSTAHTSLSADERDPTKVQIDDAQGAADPMVAYQAALAAAAHAAEKSGKFARESPTEADFVEDEESSAAYDGVEQNDLESYEEGYEDMGDFELDDDAIIAEANASALAYDADGWYGQEFGFYSAPASSHHSTAASATTDFQYANGGFFGPKGMNGLDRSQSGRMISREPNLTPITERSEYSNRNSIMSFGLPSFPSGTPVLQSPGLAQLAMMTGGTEDMNLSALLRLRSRAWGGSQISLNSSQNGSPRSERADGLYAFNPLTHSNLPGSIGPPPLPRRSSASVYSEPVDDSTAGSPSGSPTLTLGQITTFDQPITNDKRVPPMAAPQPHYLQTSLLSSPESMDPPPLSAASRASSGEWPPRTQAYDSRRTSFSSLPQSQPSQQQQQHKRPGVNHRHKSSADSISYRQEEESGETVWVMERRRTDDETGEVEMLEREVVEGGRI